MDRYRMVMRRSSYSFAEVAMWPPRSYTCGFCKREFRSAQALGGHMNLHRKDRAMLSCDSLYPKYCSTSLSAATPWSRRGDDDIEAGASSIVVGCERTRLNVSSSPPSLKFSLKPCFQAAEMNIGFKKASSMEDLDLELRLGHDPPQVK